MLIGATLVVALGAHPPGAERWLEQAFKTGQSIGHRRSLRLKAYDYTRAGAYFVTICAQDKACLFGNVADDCMCLNEAGHMLDMQWNDIPTRLPMSNSTRLW